MVGQLKEEITALRWLFQARKEDSEAAEARAQEEAVRVAVTAAAATAAFMNENARRSMAQEASAAFAKPRLSTNSSSPAPPLVAKREPCRGLRIRSPARPQEPTEALDTTSGKASAAEHRTSDTESRISSSKSSLLQGHCARLPRGRRELPQGSSVSTEASGQSALARGVAVHPSQAHGQLVPNSPAQASRSTASPPVPVAIPIHGPVGATAALPPQHAPLPGPTPGLAAHQRRSLLDSRGSTNGVARRPSLAAQYIQATRR